MLGSIRGRILLVALVAIAVAATASAQFGARGPIVNGFANTENNDGQFHYCRIVYNSARDGSGGNWRTDYPNADINLSVRLSELTRARVARSHTGEPVHLLVRLTSPELFQCPFVVLSAPGAVALSADEAARFREYLLKGGMLWADDFWGSYEWTHWERELRKVFGEDEYPIVDIPLGHPLFRTQFEVDAIPQIPNIAFWLRTGGRTSERGPDSEVPHVRGIADGTGRLMVVMTHNTDIADAWEREGEDPRYFFTFGPRGYAVGINTVLYALTH